MSGSIAYNNDADSSRVGSWLPPAPSLAALPVDRTKTEPKPAYYKLQFGDEETGFSYYVRTMTVIIGRNCDRSAPRPPVLHSPSVPPIPPLEEFTSLSLPFQPPYRLSPALDVPPAADLPIPPSLQSLLDPALLSNSAIPVPDHVDARNRGEGSSATPELLADIGDGGDGGVRGIDELPEVRDEAKDPLTAAEFGKLQELLAEDEVQVNKLPEVLGSLSKVKGLEAENDSKEEITPSVIRHEGQGAGGSLPSAGVLDEDGGRAAVMADVGETPLIGIDTSVIEAAIADGRTGLTSPFLPLELGIPPPPPLKSFDPLDHVDVDLGPLKSVSRNHAKIDYRPELGHFCLDIHGRNGAWVDDRYYVKGSTVPLNQGSHIQIATRIFSFILPPSPSASPNLTHNALHIASPYKSSHSLEDLPYPYNLPPDQVGYQEFYTPGGPGSSAASAIAAHSLPRFNAFTAIEGHGLGIDGMGEDGWLKEWDSEDDENDSGSDDSRDSYEEDSEEEDAVEEADTEGGDDEDEGEDEGEGVPRPSKPVKIRRGAQPLKPESESDTLSHQSEEEEQRRPRKGKKTVVAPAKRKKTGKKGSLLDDDVDMLERDSPAKARRPIGEGKGQIGAKQPSKALKGQRGKTAKQGNMNGIQEAAESSIMETTGTPQTSKPKVKRIRAGQSKAEPPDQAAPATPAKEAKALKASAPIVLPLIKPEAESVVLEQPSLSMLVAAANAVASGSAPSPMITTPQPTSSRPSAAERTRSETSPSPIPFVASLPRPPAPAFSATGPLAIALEDPPLPYYLTELRETPGQTGHILVNVPIPPSGAGPRPPPGPMLGLDGKHFIGPPPLKPTATFATIIHRAIANLPRGRGTLGEVCNWVAGEWEWFRLNVDSGWQNSIRHNLSLNKAFLKVARIPEDDPESKGSVWIIDPQEGPLFEERQRRDAMKSEGKVKNAELKREKDRQRVEERTKKQRDVAQLERAQAPRPLPARAIAPPARPQPKVVPPPPPPQPTIVSANAKGVLQPKAKISVVLQPITPAMRQKTVISSTDADGNILPFVCDGTTLVLEQTTFGHLTSDIIEKLVQLGAAGAVDVLSAWVINKNKAQMAKAAQAAQSAAIAKATPASPKPAPTTNNARANGIKVHKPLQPPKAAAALVKAPSPIPRPPSAPSDTAPVPEIKPVISPQPSAQPATSIANPQVRASPAAIVNPGNSVVLMTTTVPPVPVKLPGPAPRGTPLTKIIGMIAEVANAKGNVNTVGPNASALLRYIRVVGVDIDLRIAEKIWATGVVPPLPKKGAQTQPSKANGAMNVSSGADNEAGGKPATNGGAGGQVASGGSSLAPLKRKVDDGLGGGGAMTVMGGATIEQEAKKAKVDTSA